MTFHVETLQLIQPTMMAILAMGATIPSLWTPEHLPQPADRDTWEVSFCTSSQPAFYNYSVPCYGTSSSVENNVAFPTKHCKMHDDSLQSSVHSLPLHHNSRDAMIDTPHEAGLHHWAVTTANLSDQLWCMLVAFGTIIADWPLCRDWHHDRSSSSSSLPLLLSIIPDDIDVTMAPVKHQTLAFSIQQCPNNDDNQWQYTGHHCHSSLSPNMIL